MKVIEHLMYYKKIGVMACILFFASNYASAADNEAALAEIPEMVGSTTGALVGALEGKFSPITTVSTGALSGAVTGAIIGPRLLDPAMPGGVVARIATGSLGGGLVGGVSGLGADGGIVSNAVQSIIITATEERGVVSVLLECCASIFGVAFGRLITQSASSNAVSLASRIPRAGGYVALATVIGVATGGILMLNPKKLPRRVMTRAATRGVFNATRAALAATIFSAAGAMHAHANGLKYIGS